MTDILIVHDDAPIRESLLEQARRAGHRAAAAPTVREALARHRPAEPYDVVLIGTCQRGRVATLAWQARAEWPLAKVVVVGDAIGVDDRMPAARQGAPGCVPVSDFAQLTTLLREASTLEGSPGRSAPDSIEDIELPDPLTRDVWTKADRAAGVNGPVLITGESGTGKEVVARRIHQRSARRRGKFVPVNCGGLPETLVETELFGYKKGAFTGAFVNTTGLIEEAEGGVLFLDEIGDMPRPIQVRLLRFLDSGEIRPVGASCVKHVDVRVIAATNRCLAADISQKLFREDLFFRLNVVAIHVPPLRERHADIVPLAHYYARRIAQRLGIPPPVLSDAAVAQLRAYTWPGNIRELQNALEQALVQQSGGVVTPNDLPPTTQARAGTTRFVGLTDADSVMMDALRRHNGNHTETAAALGISRSTLWRRLRRRDNGASPTLRLAVTESVGS